MPLKQAGTRAVVKKTAFSRQQSAVRNPGVRTKDKDLFLDIYEEDVVATIS